jgi:ferredoxin
MEAGRSWKLEIDAAICDGHGICALCCPERIGLDEWGYASVDAGAIVDVRTLDRARRAVAACPAHALNLRALTDAERSGAQGRTSRRQERGRERRERRRMMR